MKKDLLKMSATEVMRELLNSQIGSDAEVYNYEQSVRDKALTLRAAAEGGDSYDAKLMYAALLKRFEGDFEYADALCEVVSCMNLLDTQRDLERNPEKYSVEYTRVFSIVIDGEARLKEAHRALGRIIEDRRQRAHYAYHKYFHQFVLATLPEYDVKKGGQGLMKITLDKPFIKPEDYAEISALIGIPSEQVARLDVDKVRRLLMDLKLPDHPERYVFDYVVVAPPLAVLRAVHLESEYQHLCDDKDARDKYLKLLFGTEKEEGLLRGGLYNLEVKPWVRMMVWNCLGNATFDLPCFDKGGAYATVGALVKELGGDEDEYVQLPVW